MSEMIEITQTKSLIGQPEAQRRVVRGLGLRRRGQTVSHRDNNCIRGMVNKVSHLVTYRLVKGPQGGDA